MSMTPNSTPDSNMAPVSWRALTSSRLASIKDYVKQKDYKGTYDALSSRVRGNTDAEGSKQSWDQWARQTLGKSYGTSADQRILGVEKVQLFPGWAVRRYKDPTRTDQEGAEFTLDVYVSGFASSLRPLDAATRSQKAFYRLAKGYAALPKLPTASSPSAHTAAGQRFTAPSDLDLSKLPPTPADITDETELAALEAHFRGISNSSSSSSYSSDDDEETFAPRMDQTPSSSYAENTPKGSTVSRSDSYGFSQSAGRTDSKSAPTTPTPNLTPVPPSKAFPEQVVEHAAQKMHANLDARLQPFWSNAVPNRPVRISVFCPRAGHAPSEAQESMEGQDTDSEPVATQNVLTSPQGAFQTTLRVPWERLATHPPTLHIAFGDPDVEYPVVVEAEMWAPAPVSPSPSSPSSSAPYLPYQRSNASRSQPHLPSSSSVPSPSLSQWNLPDSGAPSIKNRTTVPLSTPRVPVRLISDIDDTIKHAGVLRGAKHVFHNVFVRHLDELVVHGMVDWYRALWQRGVRFHYVSNSPFELLPVLNEFFQVSTLPQGSIKLKSYAARSLLPALLSPPAARKRQGVVEVLDAFPESRFILVGDSGEQDMELYAELARERPDQVIGVFVRDVTTGSGEYPEQSPRPQIQYAGNGVLNGQVGAPPLVVKEPQSIRPMPSRDTLHNYASASMTVPTPNNGKPQPAPLSSPFPSASSSARSLATPSAPTPRFPGSLPRRQSSGSMTVEERRVYELQSRIERARAEIPWYIAFRVFKEPEECAEVEEILDRFLNKV